MPDYGSLLASVFSNSGLIQYPDKKLYKAAMLLTPEERPTLPVRVLPPEDPIYKKMRTAGVTDTLSKTIAINNKEAEYNDRQQLAALLAHEGEHGKRIGKPGWELEGPAYQRQADVLKRLRYGNPDYMTALETELQKRIEQEKK